MDRKNIVLLGASNSRVPGGLQAGLNQDDVNLVNLSIGGTTSLHKLYSLKREENQEVLKKADLIIIESNIMDISIFSSFNNLYTISNIDYLYDELALFKTKVIILILFDHRKERMVINKFHKYKAKEYGYNIIDVDTIVYKFKLEDFYMKPDPFHMLTSIMYQLGKNIASNISCFHFPYKNKQYNHQFDIITPDQLEILNGELDKKIIKDLIYKEIVYKINKNHIFKIPERYNGFRLIGIHTFNNDISLLIRQNNMMGIYEKRMKSYSSLILEQKREKLIKFFWGYNTFQDISNSFILDKNILVKFNLKEKYSELSWEVNYID
ncbi:SGNH/GDSL hydrolase family protein, partial [Campylobacter sp. RM13744]|nr:SGNH/GDSL hydrolase family protein [Campylobacter sp. RM13744]